MSMGVHSGRCELGNAAGRWLRLGAAGETPQWLACGGGGGKGALCGLDPQEGPEGTGWGEGRTPTHPPTAMSSGLGQGAAPAGRSLTEGMA